jgi:hypothetical protein
VRGKGGGEEEGRGGWGGYFQLKLWLQMLNLSFIAAPGIENINFAVSL